MKESYCKSYTLVEGLKDTKQVIINNTASFFLNEEQRNNLRKKKCNSKFGLWYHQNSCHSSCNITHNANEKQTSTIQCPRRTIIWHESWFTTVIQWNFYFWRMILYSMLQFHSVWLHSLSDLDRTWHLPVWENSIKEENNRRYLPSI